MGKNKNAATLERLPEKGIPVFGQKTRQSKTLERVSDSKMRERAPDLAKSASAAEVLLKQLANAARLRILCSLMEEGRTVGQLSDVAKLSQSAVSQHLAKMKEAGLVEATRQGQNVIYRLCSTEVRALLSTLSFIYCRPTQ